jgi:cardiolipin synthase (CMP-forming)
VSWSFLPNLITITRVILLIPLTYYLLNENYKVSVLIFFTAGFSDALDGYLARHFSWASRFGAIMDPIADKALLVLTMAILTANNQLSLILFMTVAARDLMIVTGAYYYHWRLGPYDMAPSRLSKLNTFVQILLVTCLLISLSYANIPDVFIDSLIGLTFITTIGSGFNYFWVWGKKMYAELNKKND